MVSFSVSCCRPSYHSFLPCPNLFFVCDCMTHCIGPADGVGDVAAKCSQPGAFDCILSGQLEAEQQVLLFSWGPDQQGECINTLWAGERKESGGIKRKSWRVTDRRQRGKWDEEDTCDLGRKQVEAKSTSAFHPNTFNIITVWTCVINQCLLILQVSTKG